VLKALHSSTGLEYGACFAVISVGIRTALFPLVLYGAKTSSRFAKVVPEVQFLLTLFRNDMQKLRQEKAPLIKRMALMRTNLATLGGIYKLHKIHPFAVFLSPLLQLPIFMYISVDLRKIVNGLDPLLAQQLVDSSIGWITDLTEPDPWYGLPIIAGSVMYWNVEVALGRRSLSGAAASKSDTGVLLKDVFQSFSVFMPCFVSHLPSGVQIYVATSFVFTLVQSTALRTESFRRMVGLPSMLAPPPEAKYATEFVELKKLEQKARELRGDGPLLGKGVLAAGLEVSFPGRYRPSTIKVSKSTPVDGFDEAATTFAKAPPRAKITRTTPFIPGISLTDWQLEEQARLADNRSEASSSSADAAATTGGSDVDQEYLPDHSDEVMEKANRGERPVPTKFVDPADSLVSRATRQMPSQVSLKGVSKKVAGKKPSGNKKKGSKRSRR